MAVNIPLIDWYCDANELKATLHDLAWNTPPHDGQAYDLRPLVELPHLRLTVKGDDSHIEVLNYAEWRYAVLLRLNRLCERIEAGEIPI